ncbi:MAG: hypothetical protein SFV22_14910 [Saprospiraceae bacterium]|nr:hypothetical protein [Saprospiraceae bacterium]
MRIIGTIEHPQLKISVFRMDNRSTVKFENTRYEQTFKLGDDERFATVEGVQRWADAHLIQTVLEGFQIMHRAHLEAQARNFPATNEEIFEEII